MAEAGAPAAADEVRDAATDYVRSNRCGVRSKYSREVWRP
jgi:hypothetical protein